jgi:crotonobetainyl-CoA:carnitine CoA-transferase CaiB-like acyl-CoA transferase
MSGPLAGMVVLDLTNFVFGPVATQILADMGADVIKIEPPEGDPTRGIGQRRSEGMGSFFLNLNRNKRSVVLDLKQPAAVEALMRLAATADVLVHNMRDAAVARLGLTYEALAARCPRLVYAAAKGFGDGGPYAGRAAYDDVIQGLSGVVGLNARATGTASYAPMLLTDKLCGVYLAAAITMALVHRERTGQGQAVTVPMFETTAAFALLEHMADAALAPRDGEAATPLGYARVLGANHRPLQTADGHLCLIANTDAQWRRLFELLGRPGLIADPRFATIGARMRHVTELYGIVESHLRHRTTAEWLEALARADIPAGPVHGIEQLRDDAHLRQRGFFQSFEHPTEGPLLMPAIPFAFSATGGAIRLGPPRLGEHTSEVLATVGYTAAEIETLRGGGGASA